MTAAIVLSKNPYLTPRDGGTLRVFALTEQLTQKLGVTVHPVVVENAPPPEGPATRVPLLRLLWVNLRVILTFVRIGSVSSARWYRPRVVRDLLELQLRLDPELRIIEYSQLMGYRPALRGPVALDMHNIESELMQNYATSSASRPKALIARYEAWRLRALESRITRDVDLVAVVSEHDRQVLSRLSRGSMRGNVLVAANGVADAGFDAAETRTREVVFVAHLGWAPNVDAAEWLCLEVWPLVRQADPSITLNLVGRAPAKRVQRLAGPGIEIYPDVESVLPFVARAALATAPLQAAGGTRLKILEAMACGTPVVATSLGALGLEHITPPALSVTDEPAAFAEKIIGLVDAETDHEQVRAAAEPFRWERTLAELLISLEKTALNHSPSSLDPGTSSWLNSSSSP